MEKICLVFHQITVCTQRFNQSQQVALPFMIFQMEHLCRLVLQAGDQLVSVRSSSYSMNIVNIFVCNLNIIVSFFHRNKRLCRFSQCVCACECRI